MKLIITEKKEVNVTPELLAEMFWEMNADSQAEFFNHIGELTNVGEWNIQLEYIAMSEALDKIGKKRMAAFAEVGYLIS